MTYRDREILLSKLLRSEKQRLSATPHTLGPTSAEKLNRKRFAQRVVRRLRKDIRRHKRRPPLSASHLLAQHRGDPLLDSLVSNRRDRWTTVAKRSTARVEVDLARFSFIDDPAATLAALRRLAEVECDVLEARLHFRDAYCLDIGPYLVLGEVWSHLRPFFTGGHMKLPVQKVMEAVGLRQLMRMRLKAVRDLEDVWAFPVHRRTPFGEGNIPAHRLLRPQREQFVADRFCNEVDRWIGVTTYDLELSDEGRAWIQTILLELLDNAKRHSDPSTKDGEWSVAGFMARREEGDGELHFRCFMSILSIGATIDESLRTCLPDTERTINAYVRRHRGSGRSAATLRTLFALQDAITRDAEADEAGNGGFGFQEVMRLVDTLGTSDKPNRDPKITILSGNSCILVRKPYMRGIAAGEGSPRLLWFNPENSADVPPDPAHVFDLPDRLAGTIISLAFTLDPDYLKSVVSQNGQH